MPNVPYDAVLFDLDGTLTRSEDGILASMQYALSKLCIENVPNETLKRFIGPPLRESFPRIPGFPKDKVDEAIQHYVTHYDREGMYLYSVFPGIRTLLAALKRQGVFLAVATSKPVHRTVKLLEVYHLDRYFDRVLGEQNNEKQIGKAKLIEQALPGTYRKAAMVGDRKFDIEGAKQNGIDSIGVRYGYAEEGELEAASPTHLVETTDDLLQLLCPSYQQPRGFFLTVEGMDGSGKTTQINRLSARLIAMGYDLLQTREPGGCRISESIRDLVLTPDNAEMTDSCEALLYAASRAQHVNEVIRPAVHKGKLVLCDRFVDSSIAYQGGGRGLGIAEVAQINAFAIREMIPDATVYLRIDHMQALNRRRSASKLDRLESQPAQFYARTEEAYEQLILHSPQRFLAVDAAKPVDALAGDVLAAVLRRLDEAEGI